MADAHPTKTPAEAGPVQIEEVQVFSTEDTTLFRFATGPLFHLSSCTWGGTCACSYGAYAKHAKTRPESDDQSEGF